MSQNIKIFISCHKEYYVPSHPFFCPIQVGADLHDELFKGMQPDNTGNNISHLNRRYCELTAQYWAWKNENADYYGFFHYRRYFSFNRKIKRPYVITAKPDDYTLQYHGFDPNNMEEIINCYDVILPVPENMYVSAYNHYKDSKNHNIVDLKMVKDIIEENYQDFSSAADEYLNSTRLYFCNMFIMRKAIFNDYCNWLFNILTEFDKRKDFSGYNSKEMRVNGYLAERLLGIYCTWLKKNEVTKIGYLPRIHFEAFAGETDNFRKMKMIYNLLPPGTIRRSIVKKIFKQI